MAAICKGSIHTCTVGWLLCTSLKTTWGTSASLSFCGCVKLLKAKTTLRKQMEDSTAVLTFRCFGCLHNMWQHQGLTTASGAAVTSFEACVFCFAPFILNFLICSVLHLLQEAPHFNINECLSLSLPLQTNHAFLGSAQRTMMLKNRFHFSGSKSTGPGSVLT